MINPTLPMDGIYEVAKKIGPYDDESQALGMMAAAVWVYLSMSDFNGDDINPHLVTLAAALVALEQSEDAVDLEAFDDWKSSIVDVFEMYEQKVDDLGCIAASDMDNPLAE